MMKSCKLPRVSAMGGRSGVGRPLVGGGRRMVDVAIRDTIRAHFGQYPPEHQHTSITTRLTAAAGNFEDTCEMKEMTEGE